MWKLLVAVSKNPVYAILLVMIAGFVCGAIVEKEQIKGLKQLIVPFAFLMVYPMMVTLNIRNLEKGSIYGCKEQHS